MKLSLPSKGYEFKLSVYIKDTNIYGGVYFSRFFEWQGMAREEFFKAQVPDALAIIKEKMRLVTIAAEMIYYSEVGVYEPVTIIVHTYNLRAASVDLIFTFLNAKKAIIGMGKQRICFSDNRGSVMPLPAIVVRNAGNFLWNEKNETDVFFDAALLRKLTEKQFFL